MGLCKNAVDSYVKFGDVKRAIDCCVLLNQWNYAVELAEKNNFVQIEQLLQQYATTLIQKNKKIEAIELFRKANKNTDAARLLAEIAQELREKNAPLLLIKKIQRLKWIHTSRESGIRKFLKSQMQVRQQQMLQ